MVAQYKVHVFYTNLRSNADGSYCSNSTTDPISILVRPSEFDNNETLTPSLGGPFTNHKYPLPGYTDIDIQMSRLPLIPMRINLRRLDSTFRVAFDWIYEHKTGKENTVIGEDRMVWREKYSNTQKHRVWIELQRYKTPRMKFPTEMMTWAVWRDSLKFIRNEIRVGKLSSRPMVWYIYNTSLSEEGPPRSDMDNIIGHGQIDFDHDL